MDSKKFVAEKVEDVELIYCILKERHPKQPIDVKYNFETKKYTISLLNAAVKSKEASASSLVEIPVDLNIDVVYGDTDSVMLRFKYNRDDKVKNRYDTFKLAELCGEKLTREIFNRHPIEMEFENVKNPFILIAKKHYIGKKFEDKRDPLKSKGLDIKGVALTKRNYCNLLKRCYKEVIDNIIEKEYTGISELRGVIKKYLDSLSKYTVDIEDIIVSTTLAKSYKSDNLPHVHLAKKLKARREEVQVGDRIPFVIVESDDPKAKKYEKAEDPVYAKQNDLKIDRLHYIEHITKPILALLKVILTNHQETLNDIVELFNDYMKKCGGKPMSLKSLKLPAVEEYDGDI